MELKRQFCFDFYPGEYLRDTQCLKEGAQVAYDRIMCEHMRNICVSYAQHNFFTKSLDEEEKLALMNVLTDTGAGYMISWVAESVTKKRAYSESRAKNREGKTKEDMKTHVKDMLTYVPHMVDVDVYNNSNSIVDNVEEKNGQPEIFQATGSFPGTKDLTKFILPELKAGSVIQAVRIIQKKDVTLSDVYELFEAFKVIHFTGKKYYEDENAVQSHFINWAKTQKFNDGTKNIGGLTPKLGTGAARIEALRNW